MGTTTSLEIANMALAHCGESVAITSLSADAAKTDRLCNRFYTAALDELMELYPFRHAIEARPLILEPKTYEYEQDYNYDPVDITNITNADPCVITAASHGLSDGDYVLVSEVTGMTEINQDLPFRVTATDANTLTLDDINSTNWTAYSANGIVRLCSVKEDYQDGYIYELPSDYGIAIQLEDPDAAYEIINNRLYTITEDAVLIYVKKDITTVSLFKALFVNALSLRLAMKICLPLVGSTERGLSLLDALSTMYSRAMFEATLAASKEINIPADTTDPWLTIRG